MENYLETLSITEADKLKKTIAALFRQTCILQEKYDPVTLVPRDNEQYEICARHRVFIEEYLSIMGCELVHDSEEHISVWSEKVWMWKHSRRQLRSSCF